MDQALLDGKIPAALPGIRPLALRLLTAAYPASAAAARTKRIRDGLDRHYASREFAPVDAGAISQAADGIFAIYRLNVFPDMKMTFGVHRGHLGHPDGAGGCRCHDEEAPTTDGLALSQDCELCHQVLAQEEPEGSPGQGDRRRGPVGRDRSRPQRTAPATEEKRGMIWQPDLVLRPLRRPDPVGDGAGRCAPCDTTFYENPVPAVAALVRDAAGAILLVERGREPRARAAGHRRGVHRNRGIHHRRPAARAREETGLEADRLELLGVEDEPSRRYGRVIVVCYRVAGYSGEPAAGDDARSLAFFPPGELPELAFISHRRFIEQAIRSG